MSARAKRVESCGWLNKWMVTWKAPQRSGDSLSLLQLFGLTLGGAVCQVRHHCTLFISRVLLTFLVPTSPIALVFVAVDWEIGSPQHIYETASGILPAPACGGGTGFINKRRRGFGSWLHLRRCAALLLHLTIVPNFLSWRCISRLFTAKLSFELGTTSTSKRLL